MNSLAASRVWVWQWRWGLMIPLSVFAALVAWVLGANLVLWLVLAGLMLYGWLFLSSLRNPILFVLIFLAVLVLLPPFFFRATGDVPVYISSLLVPMGLAIVVVRRPGLKCLDSIGRAILVFLLGIGLSLPFAFILSGNRAGTESLFHWLMLAQMGLLYCLIRTSCSARACARILPWLTLAAAITSAYGILDFFWPVPIPHPSADQFIWLESSVLRRAQGVFYESGNFANFCGLFLLATAGALLIGDEGSLRLRRIFLVPILAILAVAEFLAFSRSAWGAVLAGLFVIVLVSRKMRPGRALIFLAGMGLPLLFVAQWAPEIWRYGISVRIGSFSRILADPDGVSSGRITVWRHVISVLIDNPQYVVFGVGYKTLPLVRHLHDEVAADNGYLSLLLETGIAGLVGFLFLGRAALETFLAVARSSRGEGAFWSTVLVAFWCGEFVQMLAVDAHTYWRTLTLCGALMAFTLNFFENEARGNTALKRGSSQ